MGLWETKKHDNDNVREVNVDFIL